MSAEHTTDATTEEIVSEFNIFDPEVSFEMINLNDVDAVITKARFTTNDFGGAFTDRDGRSMSIPVLEIDFETADGETTENLLVCGNDTSWAATADGLNLRPLKSAQQKLNKKDSMKRFTDTLVDSKFPLAKFADDMEAGISVVEGAAVHLIQVPIKDKDGKVKLNKKGFPVTDLTVSQYYPDGLGTLSNGTKPAERKAPKAETDVNDGESVDAAAKSVIAALLADEGVSIARAQLRKQGMGITLKPATVTDDTARDEMVAAIAGVERAAISNRMADEAFLQEGEMEGLWVYVDGVLTACE